MSMSDPRTPPPYGATPPPYRGAPPAGPLWYASPGHPTPPVPSRPPGRSGQRTALWILLGSVALFCFVGVAVVGWWVVGSGTSHPDEWDPAVAELAAFVEDQRGVTFDHPVHVEFLDAAGYREAASGGGEDGAEESATGEGADVDLGLFRALGLISGDVDLDEANSTLWSDGTAAFYDGYEDRIVVNGEPVDGEMSVELQVVVVHELTHALQHQVVDLEVLYGSVDDVATTEQADARLAVLEGDATLMERSFLEELDDAQYDELLAAAEARADESESTLAEAGVPDVISTVFSMPYQFGPSWVEVALDGPDGVDIARLLSERMPTTADVLALRVGGDLPPAEEVTAPELPDGAEELFTDSWGALSWVVPFASWTESEVAVEGAAAWAGDEIVVFRDDRDRVCFVAAIEADSTDGAAALGAAARSWADALVDEAGATAAVEGRRIEIGSCDPGAEVEFTQPFDAATALELVAFRNSIIAGGLVEGVPLEPSECFADGLLDRYGIEQLNDDIVVSSEAFEASRSEVVELCGI